MKIVLKLIHMHIIRIHHFRRDSGFSKFGVTPGGGAIAGFGWLATLLASIVDIFNYEHPYKPTRDFSAGMLNEAGDADRTSKIRSVPSEKITMRILWRKSRARSSSANSVWDEVVAT